MEAVYEILVLPFYGQGHIFPCIELCKNLSSRNFKATLIIPANLSSSIPSSFRHHVAEIPTSSPPGPSLPPPPSEMSMGRNHPFHPHNLNLGRGMESFLSARFGNPERIRGVCAVIDGLMSWSKEIFAKFDIPTVCFLTSGACSAAVEYAAWKASADEMKPGDIRLLPGLPGDMALTYSDIRRRPLGPRPGGSGRPVGPPNGKLSGPRGRGEPGEKPRWLDEVEGSIALLINTCSELERPFIDYISNQVDKPVWGVGPLLPEQFWKSADSVLHDQEIRSNRRSNYTEDQVFHWLDSKPQGSVIYVSFGSEVGPTLEEYAQLADALEELNRPFIWVIQSNAGKPGPPPALLGGKPDSDPGQEGYYPHGLYAKVGNRGLIILGWGPQLLILSHPSTGGFLSHCGWNSTVEAIGRGVPILAWPIRGDQYYDAKWVVFHLKVGYMICTGDDPSKMVKKEDIVRGMEKLMVDEEAHRRAVALRGILDCAFPASSVSALDAFRDFTNQKAS